MIKSDKLKSLCGSIANHEDWDKLQAYLLLTAQPSTGIDAVRYILNAISTLGEDIPKQFKKTKQGFTEEVIAPIEDPDLKEL
jgi:hypothetical protein